MPARLNVQYMDYDEEISTVSVEGVSIGAANFDAQAALQDALIAALNDVTLGAHTATTRVSSFGKLTLTPPADNNAQRERKWLVQMHDNVTLDRLSFEIPCADLSLLSSQAKGEMDSDVAAYTALVTAIENYVQSPKGNAVVVDRIVHVGRNI